MASSTKAQSSSKVMARCFEELTGKPLARKAAACQETRLGDKLSPLRRYTSGSMYEDIVRPDLQFDRPLCSAAATIQQACSALQIDHLGVFDDSVKLIRETLASILDRMSDASHSYLLGILGKGPMMIKPTEEEKSSLRENTGEENGSRKIYRNLSSVIESLKEPLSKCGLLQETEQICDDKTVRHQRIISRHGILSDRPDIKQARKMLESAALAYASERSLGNMLLPSRLPASLCSTIPELQEIMDVTSDPQHELVLQYCSLKPGPLNQAYAALLHPQSAFRKHCLSNYGPNLRLDFGEDFKAIKTFAAPLSVAARERVTSIDFVFDAFADRYPTSDFPWIINEAFPALRVLRTSLWPDRFRHECKSVEERWAKQQEGFLEALHGVNARVLLLWRCDEDARWFDEKYGASRGWKRFRGEDGAAAVFERNSQVIVG